MSTVSEFFASHGINPFLAGLLIGVALCAIARMGISSFSAAPKDMWTEHATVSITEQPLSHEVSRAVLESLSRGDKIGAIKFLRESTGLGLAQASCLVDAIGQAGATTTRPS